MNRNESGGYTFLSTERRPFSLAVAADSGLDIVHVTFERPLPLDAGVAAAARHVESSGRPPTSIAGFELRIPRPLSQRGFEEFNAGYVKLLHGVGVVIDGVIPAARTNVAPLMGTVDQPVVYGFSFTAPSSRQRPAFLLAGVPEEVPGDAAAMLANITDILAKRAAEVGVRLTDATDIQLYAAEAIDPSAVAAVARGFGDAAIHGLRWFPSEPPIEGLKFEIDARSSGSEVVIIS